MLSTRRGVRHAGSDPDARWARFTGEADRDRTDGGGEAVSRGRNIFADAAAETARLTELLTAAYLHQQFVLVGANMVAMAICHNSFSVMGGQQLTWIETEAEGTGTLLRDQWEGLGLVAQAQAADAYAQLHELYPALPIQKLCVQTNYHADRISIGIVPRRL